MKQHSVCALVPRERGQGVGSRSLTGATLEQRLVCTQVPFSLRTQCCNAAILLIRRPIDAATHLRYNAVRQDSLEPRSFQPLLLAGWPASV